MEFYRKVIKMDKKVGKNFDDEIAEDIFDRLRNVEGKTKPKNENKLRNITNLMNEAQYLESKGKYDEAIVFYKQVIFALPDSHKAYDAIINIYQMQGNVDGEKNILRKAITGCRDNEKFKKRLDELNR